MSRESEMIMAEDILSIAKGATQLAESTNQAIVILAKAILELNSDVAFYALSPETEKALETLAEVKK